MADETENKSAETIERINRCFAEGDMLGVLGMDSENAKFNDVSAAFRRISRLVHPDHNADEAATDAFKRLTAAKDALSSEVAFIEAIRRATEIKRSANVDYGVFRDPTTGKFSTDAFNALLSTRTVRQRTPNPGMFSSPGGSFRFTPQYRSAPVVTRYAEAFVPPPAAPQPTPPPQPPPPPTTTKQDNVASLLNSIYSGCKKAAGPGRQRDPIKKPFVQLKRQLPKKQPQGTPTKRREVKI